MPLQDIQTPSVPDKMSDEWSMFLPAPEHKATGPCRPDSHLAASPSQPSFHFLGTNSQAPGVTHMQPMTKSPSQGGSDSHVAAGPAKVIFGDPFGAISAFGHDIFFTEEYAAQSPDT